MTKKYLSKSCLLLCLMLVSFILQAQTSTSIWQSIEEKRIDLKGERHIIPNTYQTFELDVEGLKNILANAPLRFSEAANNATVELRLPSYDGTWMDFKVEEAPIMEPGLAEKYPDTKTYVARAINDPLVSVRLDWTVQGFHAMIYSPEGSIFIDPYSTNDVEHYVVYHKKDYEDPDAHQWRCGVKSSAPSKNVDASLKSFAGDCQLRSYRLAVATTGEYTAFHGGTVTNAMNAIVTTMNRVNGIYEIELGVTMVLIANNDQIVYTNSGSDPYTNNNGGTMLGQNQTTIDNVIGSANYDIGHVFSTGGGGVAYLGSVCGGSKAGGVTGLGSPINDPFDVDYVAHEIGHQFGGNHSYNNSCGGNRNGSTAMEPGSGSTIMAYAGICPPNVQNNSDDHFHAISIQEMSNFITGFGNSCATIIATNNNPPVANAGPNYTIPISTPFTLQGTATDPDGDALTSNWDQMDNEISTQAPLATNSNGPNFESLTPTASLDRTLPAINYIVNNTNNTWEVLSSVSRTFDFRFTVRDNNASYGCTDEDNVTITTSNTSGPFLVQVPNTDVTWAVGATETVTWDVANTTAAPVSCANVDILLSTDGGFTYPITLASNVPNDGSHDISVPNNPGTTNRVKVVCSDNIFFDISNTNFTIEFTGPAFTVDATPATLSICQGDNATYDITLGSLGGFNSNVNFNAVGVPAGVNANFTSASLLGSGMTTLTLSNTAGLASGVYNIDIEGTSSGVTKVAMVTLVVGAPTTSVTLSSPANGSTNAGLSPSLSWANNSAATGYTIEIATDAAFTNIVETGSPTSNNYTPSSILDPLTTYYWRVTPVNTCGSGATSSAFNFTTEDLTYCNTQGNNVSDEWIQTVTVASINNNSGSNGGYQDFTNISTNMDVGQSYPLTLEPGYSGTIYNEQWKIWIDFNRNGSFADAGELVFDSGSPSAGTVTGSLSIPSNVAAGPTRMRVSMKYNGGADPCESFDWGEVEDYTVVLVSSCPDADNDGVCDAVDVCPGGDDNVDTNNNGTPDDCEAASVSLKIYLEGAYLNGMGQMHNTLNTKGLVPLAHPYTGAPYNVTASSAASIPAQAVDWVVVEVRTGINNTDKIDEQVALLMVDGNIRATDGISPLTFNLPVGGSYYFVVRHRNHLDVMTATAVTRSLNMSYDFTTAMTQAYGSKQKAMPDGKMALFTGDNTQDLVIQISDFNLWRSFPAQLNVYDLSDLNLDGVVQTTDYDIWEPNKAVLAPTELAH